MEKADTAARIKSGKPGVPDTWTLPDSEVLVDALQDELDTLTQRQHMPRACPRAPGTDECDLWQAEKNIATGYGPPDPAPRHSGSVGFPASKLRHVR
jgi:hypothetical protein